MILGLELGLGLGLKLGLGFEILIVSRCAGVVGVCGGGDS